MGSENKGPAATDLGLHCAAARGDIGSICYALLGGQAVDSLRDGLQAIHVAAAQSDPAVVELLLQNGADANARTVATACAHPSPPPPPPPPPRPRARGLWRRSSAAPRSDASAPRSDATAPKSDAPDSAGAAYHEYHGATPLHFAVAGAHSACIEALLRGGACLDLADSYGNTPASIAAACGSAEVAALLRGGGRCHQLPPGSPQAAATSAASRRERSCTDSAVEQAWRSYLDHGDERARDDAQQVAADGAATGDVLRPLPEPWLWQQAAAAVRNRRSQSQPLLPAAAPPRFVHFSADLERIRRFRRADPPSCAAAEPASDTTPRCPDMPALARLVPIRAPAPQFALYEPAPVVLEDVWLAGQAVCGTIKVHNLAFEKHVFVRATTDDWRSAADTPATFKRVVSGADGCRPGLDRFDFALPAAAPGSHISLCVCYRAGGQEHWDNNRGANYLFKIALPGGDAAHASAAAAAAADAIPARRPSFGFGAQFSEARFAPVASPPSRAARAPGPLHPEPEPATTYGRALPPPPPPPQWAASHFPTADVYRPYSPLRASSPIMCGGSPLAASHIWPSLSATALHC
ncbi:Protein phosphatase 1 regulatory subunit 3B [Coemansia javaensis]|uniref:Protein phosphatase 1 regulatory subunit 3B n=1 Tax=Coemansia javaensis TaxID=2761396 RepID=A0A9W8HGT2_9FUNG|nr:Protein phosphatase 1 regulatory subunit 3B [Coemansia javaensis]